MKNVVVFILCSSVLISFSQRKTKLSVDSLEIVLHSGATDSVKINTYNKLTWVLIGQNLNKAKEYSDSALALIGSGYSPKKYFSIARYDLFSSEAWNNAGTLQFYKGNYSGAIDFFLKARAIFDKYGDIEKTSAMYNNVGSMLMSQKNHTDALKYFKKSESLKEKIYEKDTLNLDNTLALAKTYNNLGSLFAQTREYQLAHAYFSKALALYIKVGNTRGIAINKNNVGETYINMKQDEKAIPLFHESLKIFEEINDPSGIVLALNSLGQIYGEAESAKALEYLHRAEKVCNEFNLIEDLKFTYNFLSKAYSYKGDHKQAYRYVQQYMLLSDSLINESITRQSIEMTERYESEKKEKQIILLNKDVQLKDAINKKNKFLILIFISGSVFILLVLAAFVYAFLTKKKANKKLKLLNSEIQNQKALVDEKQKEILDSIHYARRIQNTLLATKESIDSVFPENFIYFKPKDIVSGDFYWATNVSSELRIKSIESNPIQNSGIRNQGLFYLAVCDSTGHGVPGAFMSLLNMGFLNEAIIEKHLTSPDEIFNYVRDRLVGSISKDGQKDGFDGILICFNRESKTIIYAAANNSPVLVSDGQYLELEKERMPVGKGEKAQPFNVHSIRYKQGDMLYLFTDGVADQFGGEKGKKFKYRKLNELFVRIANEDCNLQSLIINEEFENWKGNLEQVDDVCVLGLRL